MSSRVAPISAGLGAGVGAGVGQQTSFDDLGTPLAEVTFVVVDLETTGGSPATCGITEIGAVKVRGGERLGEFQTLVNPGVPIPPFIAVLTGITDSAVAHAPRIEQALPAFLEFSRGAVLVAHNAPFDIGFLKASCENLDIPWPGFGVLDTARIARRTLESDEVANCKLATLARFFRSTTSPNHRALQDARATVDVLHGLFERLGCHGVTTLEDVSTFSTRVSTAQRRKRYLAETVPRGPGVYMFRDEQARVLYVGKSVEMRARVKQYFTASESRRRMAEMVAIAHEVVAMPCVIPLEAEIRELRLIAEYKPRYNRRSRFPEKSVYLKLTVEAFPRLSVVRQVRDDSTTYLGPFRSTKVAEAAASALLEAIPLRQCNKKLSMRGNDSACLLHEMSRCGAPCEGLESVEHYQRHVHLATQTMTDDVRPAIAAVMARIDRLTARERYEEAVSHRDRLQALTTAIARSARLRSLGGCPEMVAAQPDARGGWQVVVIRHGRLAAAGWAASGVAVVPFATSLRQGADDVPPGAAGYPAATSEEAHCLLRWLDALGTRLISVTGTWSSPRWGGVAAEGALSERPRGFDPAV